MPTPTREGLFIPALRQLAVAPLLAILLTSQPVFCQQAGSAITHGPILGRLSADGVGLWARTARPGEFRVRYGLAADQLDRLSDPVETRIEHDNTGWLHLGGLEANTKYFYALEPTQHDEKQLRSGSFRTLPAARQFRNAEHNPRGLFNFSFEFACGNNQRANPALPTFKTMLERLKDKIHFAIQNGDWQYEEKRDYPVPSWLEQVGLQSDQAPRVVTIAPAIVGVWENYKLYLERGKNLAAWHREMPSFITFDDHEILGDVNGTGTPGLRSRRAVFRDIGVQAWYDYLGWANPVAHEQKIHFGKAQLRGGSDVLTDDTADFTKLDLAQAGTLLVHWGAPTDGVNDTKLDKVGGDPNAGVYEIKEILDRRRLKISPAAKADREVSYSTGRVSYYRVRVSNADFFFLDTRSYRQMHDVRDPFSQDVSMIGARQRKWLTDGMKASDADFFFVVSSVNLMVPHVGPGAAGPNKDEAWTAIAAERNELIDFWDSLGKPVFVLTGDLHNSFAIKITERVWEFASGPHNSGNHPVVSEAGRPPNGTFESRGRKCEIRWSTFFLNDSATPRRMPVYCVVQLNNVFNNPAADKKDRWVAYPRPQVVFQYYSGLTGDLLYAESIMASE